MTIRTAGLALSCAALLAAFPAAAQQKRRGPAPDAQAETERLNGESLRCGGGCV